MAVALLYLVYYGWSVVWWAPVIVFIIGIIVPAVVAVPLERGVGTMRLSTVAFIIWPVSAFLMFHYIEYHEGEATGRVKAALHPRILLGAKMKTASRGRR